MKKPNLFIVGAPKCGTTSLYKWLSRHPNIYMSPIKEPNYFNKDIYVPNRILDEEYNKLFSDSLSHHLYLGEASTRYLYSEVAAKEILRFCDKSKLIAMIRNPVDMVASLHNHLVFLGVERCNRLESAWLDNKNRRFRQELVNNKNCSDPDSLVYGEIALLGKQMERFYESVPESQRLVLNFDDLQADPQGVFNSVLEFLELPHFDLDSYEAINRSMAKRYSALTNVISFLGSIKKMSGIKKSFGILGRVENYNRVDKKIEEIPVKLRNEMKHYFRDDVLKLGTIIGRDLSSWVD